MPATLIILSESASFPWGMAAANRVRNLARALVQQGWQVEYVGLRGADVLKKQGQSYSIRGEAHGIPYRYPGTIAVRPGNWWLRRVDDFLGWLCTLFLFITRKVQGKVDVVLLYSRNENIGMFWIPFLHVLRIPVVLEMCEWPLAIARVQPGKQKKAARFCNRIVPMVDAVLPISSYIEREILAVARQQGKTLPSFRIPILIDVDIHETESEVEKAQNKPYMLYCGSIAYMDIAKIVVDIAGELSKRCVNMPLVFTGKADSAGFTRLKKYAAEKGVLDLLECTGFIPEDRLHSLMRNATCLLAPLPENPQSESRFSTKIGYYLASGTPVITNGIGDVDLYLTDGVNAYVADSCDAKEFAAKIRTLINEPDIAKKIGLAGRDLALKEFHFHNASTGLGVFIHQVIDKYVNA